MSNQYSQKTQHKENHSTEQSERPIIDKETLKKIIIDGDAQLTVLEADRIGKILVEGKDNEKLSTSQIRAVFGEVRKIQGQVTIPEHTMDNTTSQAIKARAFRRLYLLIPKMRYRVEKEKKKPGIKNMVNVLEPAVRLVVDTNISKQEQEKRFGYFVEFFEAILAYHCAYGGK